MSDDEQKQKLLVERLKAIFGTATGQMALRQARAALPAEFWYGQKRPHQQSRTKKQKAKR